MLTRKEQISTMQKFLKTLRKVSNLKVEEISSYIGLSQQGYRNIEKMETPLNVCQYITLRLLFEYIGERDDNQTLNALIELLFNNENSEDIQNIKSEIIRITREKQTKKKMVEKLNYMLLTAPVMACIPIVGGVLAASLLGMLSGISSSIKKYECMNNNNIKPWIKSLFD